MALNTELSAGNIRAAIFMLALGTDEASKVLKHMGAKEVQAVSTAMAKIGDVSTQKVHEVLQEFLDTVGGQTSLGIGSDAFVRSMLGKALGQDKAKSLVDRIMLGGEDKGIEELKWMDPRAVAEVIRLEHPQIQAIVLSLLESDHAAQTLAQLPESTRSDIIIRVASLDGVPPSALQELNAILEKQFSGSNTGRLASAGVGGVKTAANILNEMDSVTESRIRDLVKQSDESLGEQIEELMFVFENLLDLDDRGFQAVLREIQTDSLALAMKGASEPLREKIFTNMSKRAAELLRDDLETQGPVKLSDVEVAQKEIVGVARRLADDGTIALGGPGGDEYV